MAMQNCDKRYLQNRFSGKQDASLALATLHLCPRLQRGLLAGLLLVTLLCSYASPILAAEPVNSGSDSAHPLTPTDSWVALAQGERHWYAFRDEGDSAAISVRLTVLPATSATFWVLTATQANYWVSGEDFTAVGAGTEHLLFNNDSYWTGSFVQSGIYYLLVENSGQSLSNYRLTISGQDISFPIGKTQLGRGLDFCVTDRSLAPTAQPTPVASATEQNNAANSSAEQPLPPVGQPWAIADGETHWYAFRDEGDASSIQVRADTTPDNCLTFQVWTPDQLRLWQLGETFRPIGQGTANTILKADLFWTGSFVKAGIYYVVVKHPPAASGVCTYKLWVTGDDFSLLLPSAKK